jgi:ATP-dependent helicase/nuclease subunit B
MKIDVVVGNNFKDVNQTAIKMIDVKNFKFQNYIIVPDRFSLLMEKLIFQTLKITSTLNISVMGISRFAAIVFEKLDISYDIVSKQESLLILRTAMIKLKPKLKFFKNSDIGIGLCEELYAAITQLKANEISPNDLIEILPKANSTEKIKKSETVENIIKTGNQADKIFDIALIFDEYEKLLEDRADSTRLLTCLEKAIYIKSDKLNFSNYNFFFLNFDSLTNQGYSILKALATAARNVCVGTLQPDFQKNSYIFENDIFEKLKKLSITENIELNLIFAPCTLKEPARLIHKNLYSLNIESETESDFIEIFEAPDMAEEIFEVARKINYFVKFKNIKFKQIAVACSDLNSYAPQIENIFREFDFSFYLDTSINLTETSTIKYLLTILNLIEKNFPKDLVETFFIDEFTQISKQSKNHFLDIIEKYNLQSNELFEFVGKYSKDNGLCEKDFEKHNSGTMATDEKNTASDFNYIFKEFEKFKDLVKLKSSCRNGKDYIKFISSILEKFEIINKNNQLIEKFKTFSLFKDEKLYIQIPEKTNKVLTSLEKFISEQDLSFKEFINIFESALTETKLSTIPISVNSIFVGDATNSFFEEVDFLFVLGANQGLMPRSMSDSAIIGDDLIENLSSKMEISPTVKMINRRNRFKIFNLLLQPQLKIFISYILAGKNQDKLLPSRFIFDLQKIFSGNAVPVKKASDYVLNLSTFQLESSEKFCHLLSYFCANKRNAMHQFLKFKFQYKLYSGTNKKAIDGLNDFLQSNMLLKNFDFINNFEIDNSLVYSLISPKINVSQIENYYLCPFKQFASNALKLKEKDSAELMAFDTGNVLHKVAEEFLNHKNKYIEILNNYKQNLKESDVKNPQAEFQKETKKIIERIFNKLRKNDRFYKLNLRINENAVEILENESLRLCEFLYYTQTVSRFTPTYLELRFGGAETNLLSSELKDIEINGQKLKLSGVVDRVDIFENMFIVIDYKSGAESTGSYSEVFYGEKIQIFIYLKVLEKLLNKKACGAFYFPIKNEYKREKSKNYMMKGKAIDDVRFLSAMDTSVGINNFESKIFPCKLNASKKNLEIGEKVFNKTYTVSENILNSMMDYSFSLFEKGIDEILQGNICPSPRQDSCRTCKFAPLCLYDKKQFRNKTYKIEKAFFENFNNENNETQTE